jgi:hypothetical protein
MRKDDMKVVLDALTALHERLLRVESWMINHEERSKDEERGNEQRKEAG